MVASFLNEQGNIKTKIIEGKEAEISNSIFLECINKGGVALLRVWDNVEHYVLCTKVEENSVYIFDPYYCPEDDFEDDMKVISIGNLLNIIELLQRVGYMN